MDDEVLAVIEASMIRRWMGIGMLVTVGGLVLYVALASPPSIGWQIFLIVMGACALYLAEKMRRATESGIELTETELRDTSGVCIARIADIQGMDRGFFAFKPSNGFLVRTKKGQENMWRPGLWWRLGRRIGVGGVVSASQSKGMSEILAALLAMRDQDSHTT